MYKNFNGLIILDDIRTSLFEKSNFQFHLAFFAFIFYGGRYLYNCQNDGQSFGLWLTNKTVVHTSKKKVHFLFLFFRRRKINICTIGNTQKIIILFKLRRMIYLCCKHQFSLILLFYTLCFETAVDITTYIEHTLDLYRSIQKLFMSTNILRSVGP